MTRATRLSAFFTVLLGLAVGAAGCDFIRSNSSTPENPSPTPETAPSTSGSNFQGRWISGSQEGGVPSPDSCTNFVWDVDQSDPSNVTAQFTATCGNGFTLGGSGTGVLNGNLLTWTASGSAVGPGGVTCDFLLNGTAEQVGEQVMLDYFGSTCIGPITGNELLRRP